MLSKEEVANCYRELCSKIGKTATSNDIEYELRDNPEFSPISHIIKLFKSFDKLRLYAGVERLNKPYFKYSKADLDKLIKEIIMCMGR